MRPNPYTAAAEARRDWHFALLAALLLLAAALTNCTAARPSLLSDTTRTERATSTHIR